VDPTLNLKHRFSSANSINIGRLLPQMAYYVASSLEVERRTGAKACYIIPAGNLGNAMRGSMGARAGVPRGSDHLGAQRQQNRSRLPAERRVAASPEHTDLGLCNGCWQSQQYGAPPGSVSDAGFAARTIERAQRR